MQLDNVQRSTRGRKPIHSFAHLEDGEEHILPASSAEDIRKKRIALYLYARRRNLKFRTRIVDEGLWVLNATNAESKRTGTVYFLKCGDFPLVKIGFANDLKDRMRSFIGAIPFKLTIINVIPNATFIVERYLHDKYHYARTKFGEWFFERPAMHQEGLPSNGDLDHFARHNVTPFHMARRAQLEQIMRRGGITAFAKKLKVDEEEIWRVLDTCDKLPKKWLKV